MIYIIVVRFPTIQSTQLHIYIYVCIYIYEQETRK